MTRTHSARPDEIHYAEIQGRTVPIKLRVNRRAKRLIIKADPLSQSIILTCPTKKSIKEGLVFIAEKQDWLSKGLREGPKAKPFVPGAVIPLKGAPHQLIHTETQRRAVMHSTDTAVISIGGQQEHFGRRTEDWLRQYARETFMPIADQYCAQIQAKRKRLTIRDTKSRWGSCSSDGAISLNWRLILAPPYVYEYVIAHEVSHLRHMDHSPAFWSVVNRLLPDKRPAQNWLKSEGNLLQAYGRHDS